MISVAYNQIMCPNTKNIGLAVGRNDKEWMVVVVYSPIYTPPKVDEGGPSTI